MSESKQKPIFKKQLRYGIASAVFERHSKGTTYRSVNLHRSYRKNDEWQRMTIYLDDEHIPFMIEALKATWEFLNSDEVETWNVNCSGQSPKEISNRRQAFEATDQLSGIEITEIKPITSKSLLAYLAKRGIDATLAAPFIKQVHFKGKGKDYFAIGFENDARGFELRNPYFKGSSSKETDDH